MGTYLELINDRPLADILRFAVAHEDVMNTRISMMSDTEPVLAGPSSDAACAAELAVSSWEKMAAEAAAYAVRLHEEHSAALQELLTAEMQDFHAPGVDAGVRLLVARVALGRIERRLGK